MIMVIKRMVTKMVKKMVKKMVSVKWMIINLDDSHDDDDDEDDDKNTLKHEGHKRAKWQDTKLSTPSCVFVPSQFHRSILAPNPSVVQSAALRRRVMAASHWLPFSQAEMQAPKRIESA
jgi:hypothetical protein